MSWPNPSYTRWLGGGDRAVIEDGLTFSVHPMMRAMDGVFSRSGVWQWTRDGERCASISYFAEKWGEDCGRLKLSFRVNGESVEQVIHLLRRPCRYGGGRWFATCPHTGRTVAKLCLPAGGRRFLSRQAYRLAYRSQSLGRAERALLSRDRVVARLGLVDWEFPRKPKWMRRRTFERAVARLDYLDEVWTDEARRRFGADLIL